jgi:TetR/AcrR family transcriptional repressor of mexJK operon
MTKDNAAKDRSSKDKKRDAILDASNQQFRTYGYRKTSMDDIAKHIGISRASLYSYFADKDDIFREVAMQIHEQALAATEVCLRVTTKHQEFSTRIKNALMARHSPFQEAVTLSTHGGELFDEYSRLCGDIVADSNRRFQAMLVKALNAAVKKGEINLKASGVSAIAAAEILNLSAAGLKHGALDIATFEKRAKDLVNLFVTGPSKANEG